MAQLTGDSFAFGGRLMRVEEALGLIGERIRPVPQVESVPLAEADGRFLADAIIAPIDLPPFDNSAVDGWAVRHADLSSGAETSLPVVGRLAAGDAGTGAPPSPGTAVRIFTGAPMPPTFDTVFMQEDVVVDGERVRLPAGLSRGANARTAGEDMPRGGEALPVGRRIGPREIALLAALGTTEVRVRGRLRVAVFSTGDEVRDPGRPLGPGALYDSNRFVLGALCRRMGAEVTDLGILPDHRETIAAALAAAGGRHDLILTSGGVSTGEEDHVKGAVEDAGSLTFWRIGIKPGRPVAMGVVGDAAFAGLPGNPVAVFVTFAHVVRPLLSALAGGRLEPVRAFPVLAGFSYRKKEGRREYVRVLLEKDGEGRLLARKHPREGAGVITSLTETDGLVELDEDRIRVEPGEIVGFIPYAALL